MTHAALVPEKYWEKDAIKARKVYALAFASALLATVLLYFLDWRLF